MSGFGGSIKLTGESDYKKALSQINQNLKETASQMKLVTSAYDKNDTSAKSLRAQSKSLNTMLTQQKDKVKLLKDQYKALSKEQDVDEKSLSKLRTQINLAQADVNNTKNALKDLKDRTKEAGDEAKKASDSGFTVMKGVLANLATQAISSAISGLQQMGAAFIDVGKQALESYAEYEQLVGGVETLFKDSAGTVQDYANNAYKTAGLSANEYMETVTSFSASLLQGLNGDTAKTADVANQAIIDMSDNANKMGTSMESIQNAYQGFAKGNYTMLDNLKLGYGGTKTEMLRLVQDAGVVSKSVESMDDVSFDQIIEAIHIVQTNMGITGTTAKEASVTIEGSTAAMKSAWQNFITGIADDNADMGGLIQNLVDSVMTVGDNILPRVQTIIQGIGTAVPQLLSAMVPEIMKTIPPLLNSSLPLLIDAVKGIIMQVGEILPIIVSQLASLMPQILSAGIEIAMSLLAGIRTAFPDLMAMMPEIITSFVETILSAAPEFLETGKEMLMDLVNGIDQALPELGAEIPNIINTVIDILTSELPMILEMGVTILTRIIDGITQAIPTLVQMLPEIITTIVTVLIDSLPLIIQAGVGILVALIEGLRTAIPQLVQMLPEIITNIVTKLQEMWPQIKQAGQDILTSLKDGLGEHLNDLIAKVAEIGDGIRTKFLELVDKIKTIGGNIVTGLWNGINDKVGWVLEKIRGFGASISNGIKNFFGIHSPSTLMRDQVGKNIALGLIDGVNKEKKNAKKSAEQLSDLYVKAAKSRVSEMKKAGEITAAQEIQLWETIVSQAKKGSSAYNTAVSKLNEAKKKQAEEAEKAAEKERQATEKQIKALEKEKKAIEETQEKVKKLSDDFEEDVKKINEKLNEDIKQLEDKYNESVQKRTDAIMGQFGLFDKVSLDKGLSSTTLINSLSNQVKALDEWDQVLDSLSKRIQNKDLLEELQGQGVESLNTLESINNMSDEELRTYEELFAKKQEIAKQRALAENRELLKETKAQIQTLKKNAAKQINGLQQTYIENLKKLGINIKKPSQNIGKQVANNVWKGFKERMEYVDELVNKRMSNMLKNVTNQMAAINAAAAANWAEDTSGNAASYAASMAGAVNGAKNAVPKTVTTKSSRTTGSTYDQTVSAFKTALGQMTVEMDGENMGSFVTKTVARAVYS